MDRTEALNIAFALYFGTLPNVHDLRTKVLAVWYFFRPDWCTSLTGDDLKLAKDLLRLRKRPTSFDAHNSLVKKYPEIVVMHEQRHGDIVHVPAGWPHMVGGWVGFVLFPCVLCLPVTTLGNHVPAPYVRRFGTLILV